VSVYLVYADALTAAVEAQRRDLAVVGSGEGDGAAGVVYRVLDGREPHEPAVAAR
jgi:hypothetical protein